MPVVQTTIIEGYDAATKSRLLKGMTRVVRSVMAAPPDGVVTILHEVSPSSYARGGVSRTPGPPLPPAVEVAAAFAEALARRDAAGAAALAAEGFRAIDAAGASCELDGLLASMAAGRKVYERFDEALTDEGSLVFASGTLEDTDGLGRPFIDRFRVMGGKIVEMTGWGAGA